MNGSLPNLTERERGRFRRVFSMRGLRMGLFIFACLATLIALFYTVENWRGKRAWNTYRGELEAKGVKMDWAAYIPGPVPDDQNLFKAPGMTEWFVKASRQSSLSNELASKFRLPNTNWVVEVLVTPPTEPAVPAGTDLTLTYNPSAPISADRPRLDELQQVIQNRLALSLTRSNGPSLEAAAGTYVFVANPPEHLIPIRVLVRAEKGLDATNLARFLPGNLFAAMAPGGGAVRVEPVGSNTFHYVCAVQRTMPAAEYLAWTDPPAAEVASALNQALARPFARPEGNYDPGWIMPIPNFVSIRTLEQILAQRSQCDLLLGRSEAAGRELSLLRRACRLLEARPTTLVSAMIEVAVTGLYTSMIADGLRLHAWKEPELIALQQQLAEINLVPTLLEAFRAEQVGLCHGLEIVKPSELDAVFAFGPEKPNLWEKFQSPTYWLLRWMPRGWVYQNMVAIAAAHQTVIETVDLTNGSVQPSKVDKVTDQALATFTRSRPYTYMAAHIIPNFFKAIRTTVHNQVSVREAMLACALERYRLAHQDYPETLAALTPQFIDRIPLDIVNGQPMKYRRNSDGQYVLYSIGWNETDDGGVTAKSATDGDWVWDGHNK